MTGPGRALRAHVVPFAAFMGFLGLVSLVATVGEGSGVFWLTEPAYWIYPLQTMVCAGLLVFYWKCFDWGRLQWWPAVGAGLLVFAIWVAPQTALGFPARTAGFDPGVFDGDPPLYWLTVVARLMRLVVVVPLVEEIFWRGFLMRYLIKEDFEKVPFGTWSPLSFFGVAGAFMFVHSPADWPAAFVTGLLFGWVCVKTRSLLAAVIAHAVANAALGAYILSTKQWGFW